MAAEELVFSWPKLKTIKLTDGIQKVDITIYGTYIIKKKLRENRR